MLITKITKDKKKTCLIKVFCLLISGKKKRIRVLKVIKPEQLKDVLKKRLIKFFKYLL